MTVDNRQSAINKVDETYAKELEALKIRYTKRGDLGNANKISALVEKARDAMPLSAQFVEHLLDGEWYYTWGKKVYPRSFRNGKVVTEEGKVLSWTLEDRLVTIDWEDGGFEYLTINPSELNVIHGKTNSGTQIAYTRKVKTPMK